MRNQRSYYSSTIAEFIDRSQLEILGIVQNNDETQDTSIQQRNAWSIEVEILKKQLSSFKDGRIIFEYTIPRIGKRVDVIIIYCNIIFLLEFKCGEKLYRHSTYDQVYDYALDLRNFHKGSHDKLIVSVMVSTEAEDIPLTLHEKDRIIEPIRCNKHNIANAIYKVCNSYTEKYFDPLVWEASDYLPTPTIIEAAQALYTGHRVDDISRNDSGAKNMTATTDKINEIITLSKHKLKKSICFVTGVPGAGKTLVGLNVAIQRANAAAGEHAVFLSGNFPLVHVLQEALARDQVAQQRSISRKNIKKQEALRRSSAFIQIIHKYRDYFINNNRIPPERIVIFDEAQRAWTKEQISKFMKTKKGILDFQFSEPEFLVSTMDRHTDWAVIICLVGGGQEINTGEAGLPEWFDAMRRSFRGWDIYISDKLSDNEYLRGKSWEALISNLSVTEDRALHLSTSMRSFRSPEVSDFINALLNIEVNNARALLDVIKGKYPIVITRDLSKAKEWVRSHCRGTTRYGLLASSSARRLKPEGIFVKNEINVADWFLNGKDDIRTSYALEDVVTEFDIQGLELDYTLVAWDADLRFDHDKWEYYSFKGSSWMKIIADDRRLYLKNAYRVLLTRARQGMAIFLPWGSDNDITRKRNFYDLTYNYLKNLGLHEV